MGEDVLVVAGVRKTYEAEQAPTRYRLIVLSRNLTYDRSWDVATSLVGEVSRNSRMRMSSMSCP